MGCQNSKHQAASGHLHSDSPLTAEQIKERTEAPKRTETIDFGGFKIRHAYLSQRGYYPDDPHKANQDNYYVDTSFDNNKNKALFMVFDGHGKEGDKCATFCRQKLPPVLSKKLALPNSSHSSDPSYKKLLRASDNSQKDNQSYNQSSNVESALTKAFMETNEMLHRDPNVDDALSGTTAVGVYFEGRDIWIANVGDSRAIICQEHENKLVARPLSSDQTPYRKDERERVKACGARVMSMDQIEGIEPIHENWGDVNLGEELDEGGDPPRIWSPFGEYPGTAFTRSIGDVIAEELGVSAEPEVIHRKLQSCDRYLILASDGVFEFLTNQSVADMVVRYDDPLEACKRVVQEAYDLWLRYEVRADDITIIIICLEDIPNDFDNSRHGKGENGRTIMDMTSVYATGLRPVRREMSRRQRHFIVHNEPNVLSPGDSPRAKEKVEDYAYKVEEHIIKKTDAECSRILNAIDNNFLFENITEEQQKMMLDVMIKVNVKAGELVIRQGDTGDRFYIVDSGIFEVRVNQESSRRGTLKSIDSLRRCSHDDADENSELARNYYDNSTDMEAELGPVVFTYEPSELVKPCFGHLALLYSKPRSASVVARENGVLWALDRPVFKKIIVKKNRREVAKTLRKVDALKCLNFVQLQQLCDNLVEVEYAPNEVILKQGEIGDSFYVIYEGSVVVTKYNEQRNETAHVRRLHEYGYFGESNLLAREPRNSSVTAETHVKCLQISRRSFEELLGPLRELIDKEAVIRKEKKSAPKISELKVLGIVTEDDLGQMNLVKLPSSNSTYTLRTMWKSDVSRLKQKAAVMKAAELHKYISDKLNFRRSCVAVPLMMGTYNDKDKIHVLQHSVVVGNLSQILNEKGKLSIDCVRHISACVVLGLEALHKANMLYRALSPELICLDSRGFAVLMEFRLAKIGLEGSTLCGTPEYFSPEQVHNQAHGKAVDFWALGVLIYELAQGVSPFAAQNELETFNNITSHKPGRKVYPTSFSPALSDFLDRLLQPNPKERLGAKRNDITAIKTHQWFAGFDWAGLSRGEYFNQELRQIAHEKIQKMVHKEGTLNVANRSSYEGEQSFWERF